MIVITKADDLAKIKEKSVIPYIKNLLSNIQKAYCPDRSLESVGAIYFLENEKDFDDFKKFGLSGRSIIPLLLGFGCTASGTCAAKTSDCAECSKRTLSALMFIPCGARLPLVLLFCNVLFSNADVPVFVFFYIYWF